MFTSPSGRGRHLYYSLAAPMLALPLFKRARFRLSMHPPPQNLASASESGVAGLDIFPCEGKRVCMPSLPLGRGSFLCDAKGFPIIHGTVQEKLLAVVERLDGRWHPILAEDIPPGEVVAKPKQPAPSTTDVALPKVAGAFTPASPSSPKQSSASPPAPTAEDWLQHGLTGKGQRRSAVRCLAKQLRAEGVVDHHEAVELVVGWLQENHNGKSVDYNEDAQAAIDDVAKLVEQAYAGQVVRPSLPAKEALLIAEKLRKGIEAGGRPALAGPAARTARRNLLYFACDLAALLRASRSDIVPELGVEMRAHSSRLQKLWRGGKAYRDRLSHRAALSLVSRDSSYQAGERSKRLLFALKLSARKSKEPDVRGAIKKALGPEYALRQFFFSSSDWSRFLRPSGGESAAPT